MMQRNNGDVKQRRHVCRARIDGRLHSVGDTVHIPYLGYNGTILRFCGREFVAVVPHDKGQPVLYLCTQLKRGSGINTANRIWLRQNGVTMNDAYRNTNLPTRIHRSRPHFNCCPIYIAEHYANPINVNFPALANPPVREPRHYER